MLSEHSGENQAAILIALFTEYNIGGNIRYFIADNTESNNMCIDAILQALYPNISAKKQKARQLQYFGHITNLYTQAFIVGKDSEKIYKALATAYHDLDFDKVEKL